MIAANELRIGNKIRRKSTGAICTVNWGIIRDAENGNDVSDYEYIELTPENCKVFGIKYNHSTFTLDGLPNWFFCNQGSDFWFINDYEYKLRVYEDDIEQKYFYEFHNTFKFLHQIQNLYFGISQEELNLSI